MNTTVFIAWRSGGIERGAWSPVARLEYAQGEYRFVYTKGARLLPGFHPFPGMGDLQSVYRSRALFPMLTNRLLSRSRPEYEAWLTWSGFDPKNPPDPLAVLGVTEGIRQTDALEVFPMPVADAQGNYATRFFLHGLRHASAQARERLTGLRAGNVLRVELEDANEYDPHAVAVLDDGVQPLRLGYVPRYLARDVRGLVARNGVQSIDLRVARVNHGAPLQMRLLCTLQTPWPRNFAPCAGAEFQPIAEAAHPVRAAHGA
ncbi:HIRAN domain-containing protein [Salinisphaera sp.]|uniref:HIRAN domain-containing protein n=1 Tax=Salinisphaera sp. TaxID=1914330 RepID=UPI002D794F72|nr:HIRAN domain-containing protein [Salinisphaera sp.]HET7313999.1 HIRAN domain-containing protein [Salinisphaera sp.]